MAATPSGSEGAPYQRPLTYPGTPPPSSGLLVDGDFRAVEAGVLDNCLRSLRLPRLDDRLPVIAVGSNASPAQVRAKFRRARREQVVIPMTTVRVKGVVAGVSAHVSRPGYIPATPVVAEAEESRLFVLWLDSDQLGVIDATEPNYNRVVLDDRFALTETEPLRCRNRFHLYASKHGCLLDPAGSPRRLTPQPALIRTLLAESEGLRALAGPAPADWVRSMKDAAVREAARTTWITDRRVLRRPLA